MISLHRAVDEYVSMRRTLGFRLHCYDTVLHDFIRFLKREGADHITTELALRWATRRHDHHPAWWANQLIMLRGFARYWSAKDPRTEVPPLGLLPSGQTRRTPHLYTEDQIGRIIKAAGSLGTQISSLWPATMSTLIGLLAVTGMRIGEALRLNHEDIDWREGVLAIHRSKFRKSRLVPMHDSTTGALRRYAQQRDRIYPPARIPSFFVSQTGKRLMYGHVHKIFGKLLHKIGLPRSRDRRGPGLHDLRHRFAVATVVRWYRAGLDVERHMLSLSTYLGHRRVVDTYWYLSAAPELMGLAAARLERFLGHLP